MNSIKYFTMIILVLILTSCSLANETEKQKLFNYLESNEDYKKYKDKYVLNVDGDLYSDISYYYNNEISYAYYEIDTNNFKYSFEDKYYYSDSLGDSIVHIKFTYNPVTNISEGSYVLNTYSDRGEMATVHEEYSYMYDYNTGTSECAHKLNSFSQAEECIISGNSFGKNFLNLKEGFLTLLKSSGISEKKFYDEIKE